MSTDTGRARVPRDGPPGGTGTASRPTVDGERRRIAARRGLRRARRRLRRGRRAVARAVTPLGWFVLALTVGSVVLGVAVSWVEAWTVAVAGGLLLLIAVPFLLGGRSYRVRIEPGRRSVVVGGEVPVHVRIANPTRRPALPAVAELPLGPALRELTIPWLGPGAETGIPVSIPAPRRGVIRVGPLTVSRRDPVGLLHREVTWDERHLLHVHPATVRLPRNSAGLVRDLDGAAGRRLSDADLSFYAVREYAPGDAMRQIHWRSTAKTGALMVRQYEESQTARVAVLFDARPEEYRVGEEFELAVSAAASISVQAVREGRERFVASAWAPGRLAPGIDGLEELPSRDPQRLLDAWAELEAAPEGLPIEALAHGLAHAGRHLSVVAVVTGSVPDHARIRRAAAAFSSDVGVLVVRCALHAEPAVQRIGPLTVCTIGALVDLPQLLLRSAR